ncbi:MAG: glycerophosphodiester phosphodiesterase [Haloferacaceae archaeon]
MTDTTLVAHRGFAGTCPENTVAAFEAAAASGADAVELDVMPCADGEVVVFHDDRLEGVGRPLTDREGVVWETPCEEVLAAEVLDSGETVPTLDSVLDALPADVAVTVELKNPGSFDLRPGESLPADDRVPARRRWQGFVNDVVDVVAGYDHDVLFSSFCEGALAAVRHRDDDYPTAVIVGADLHAGRSVARRYDVAAVHVPWNAVAGTPFSGESYLGMEPEGNVDVVAEAHEAGREVAVWTVDTWYRAAKLREAGADGLIADYPGLLGEWER